MKFETIIAIAGAGAVGYLIASKLYENYQYKTGGGGGGISLSIPSFENIPSIKDIPENISKKISQLEEQIKEISITPPNLISKPISDVSKTIEKATEPISKASETIKKASEDLKKASENIASIPKTVVEKIQPVVTTATIGGIAAGPIGMVVAPTFYRVGWEIGKVTKDFGHWLIEKTGGYQSPIYKIGNAIASILGRW
ncbi:MAG: hypothetical protein QXL14_02400 [Candidatus Aenigmatarchaeota archaeon]